MSTKPNFLPAQFPPLEWLGYGVDMTRLDPFDYKSVYEAKTQVRIVDTTKDKRIQDVKINGIEYQIPKIVVASEDSSASGTTRTFSDGELAVKALQDDSALAYRLLPATTSDISLFPLDKSLPQGNQFYFFANDYDAYSGGLRDYLAFINEEEILTHVSKLVPFDAENPEVVQAYIEFFNAVGSHFVTSTGYGARFLLEVWALNKYQEVNDNFVRDITASVEGLNNGGEYDNTVFGEAQYWNFNRLSQRIIRIRGGNSDLADSLVLSPDFPTFQQWTQSISDNAELITLRATGLWTLLRDADDAKLRASARNVQDAFEYLSSLRQPNDKRTWITFELKSNWGEFGILTPSAVIGGGDTDQFAVQQPLTLGPAKLSWGQSSPLTQHFIAVCDINNDGTPIDIYVGSGPGSASVRILGVRLNVTHSPRLLTPHCRRST
ncbi:hypothetical protein PISMIDRAFT_457224 [Pisolithus microcarpus 441]|uniref:MACPF domain-containing protein n=1 Tax=Pisolithus microcarpus 441 TaxID=765257 RepID=A0A0C9YEH0_9AGAM|nr:hypothetical protein BKA83DRAFT_457224 [Pisolithus microcarpus]KIK12299.1 hypothetical protein PISMIDRAFT_457224 [Pisolithus microcarpus 441]